MTSSPSYEILVLEPGHSLIQDCFNIRIEVFANEQGFPLETEIDDLDNTATHALIRVTSAESPIPVGTARVSFYPDTYGHYRLGRLAVLKDYRKYRFGINLMQTLEKWTVEDAPDRLKDTNQLRIVVHSQMPVKSFYEKYGYITEGEVFDEEGAPHQNMVKTIQFRN